MPCVAMGATEDTNRDCSSDKANRIGGSAQVFSSLGSTATRRRRDGMMKQLKPREFQWDVRTRIMMPRLFESASLSHKCFQGESHRTEKGRGRASPLATS